MTVESLETRALLTPVNWTLDITQSEDISFMTTGNDLLSADSDDTDDHFTLKSGTTLRSTGGDSGGVVTISAGENLTIEQGANVIGVARVVLQADYYGSRGVVFPAPVDPDPGTGGTITLNGRASASTVELWGHTDNDTFIVSANGIAQSSNLTIDGWDGSDIATLDLTGATGVTLTRTSNTSSVLTFTRSGGGSETVTFRNVETINTTGVTPTFVDNAPPVWGTLPSAINIVKNTATGADMTNAALLSQLQTLVSDLDDSSLTFTANPTTFPTGTTSVVFTATDDAGNSANATINVVVADATLTLDVAQASVSENGGTSSATVTRNSTSGALTVTLSSDDTTAATVPATVTIADGQTTSPAFTVTAVDDALVDGTQTATITASATGHVSGTDTLNVTDDDVATLTVTILASSINESDGAAATTATVSRNTPTTAELTVTLASNDTGEATVPATVTIAAGQTTSAPFNIDAVDDALQDGNQTVTITASATGHADGTDTLTVTDDEVHTVIVSTNTDIDDNNLADGELSLREAVRLANADADQSVIRFADSMRGSTILLGGTELALGQNVMIVGMGANQLTVDANGASRVFRALPGSVVALSGLSITGGNAALSSDNDPTYSGLGGGILNENASLTISASRIHGNSGTWGAGVNNWRGTLTIEGTTLDNNNSTSNGGALYNWGDGGIASATLQNSTVSGNSANSGGGIANWNGSGAASLTATNSTIVMNSDSDSDGSGIDIFSGNVTLHNSLVAGNTASGGLAADIFGTLVVSSANNLVGTPAFAGGLTHAINGNIVGDGTGNALAASTVIDTTLTANFGSTSTHALVANSPAIDAGNNSLAVDGSSNVLTTDQRGFKRILDGDNNGTATVDIGAVEAGQVAPITLVVSTNTDVVDGDYSTGELSLREAITIANGRTGADTITFASGVTSPITISSELAITDSVTITGPGASVLAVSGGSTATRIFNIDDGTAAFIDVTISGLTIRDGGDGVTLIHGVGITSVENLNIDKVVLANNNGTTAAFGGGLNHQHGSLKVTDSTFSGNTAVTGAGVFTAFSRADFRNVLLTNNNVVSNGAVLEHRNGVATLSNVTVDDTVGTGYAVLNIGLAGNTAEIYVTNSTFVGNSNLGLVNFAEAGGTVTGGYGNSLFATFSDSVVSTGAGTLDVTSSGFNIFQDTPTGDTVASDRLNTDPLIGPLQDNGGPTFTRALLSGSPAIDTGDNNQALDLSDLTGGTVLTTDQRGTGFARVVDGDVNATATVDVGAFEFTPPVLTVAITEASISENGGTGKATVTRTGDTSTALTVNLSSDQTTEATVPATVVIAAGQTISPEFDITGVDDAVVDGSQTVTITASADGTISGTDTLEVTDDDTAALTLTIVAASVSEGDGATATTATVSRNTPTTAELTVTLTSSMTGEATVPATVTIPAGQTTSAPFNIAAVDDALVDGTKTVTITATAAGHANGTDTLDVTDNESATLTVAIAAASISEAGGATATTGTVTRNGDTTTALTVTLTSSDVTEATVPATVTIAAGQTTSPAFNIAAVDDSEVDGTQTVTITASATGVTSGTDTVDVTDDDTVPPGFAVTAPINRTDSKRPLITWTPVDGALSYDVWVNRVSLGGEPVVNLVRQPGLSAAQASYQTNVDLEFGLYRIYVYANMPGGAQQESAPHTFVVDEQPVLSVDVASTVVTKPTFTWSRVPGASTYVVFVGKFGGNVIETVADSGSGATMSYTVVADLPTNDYFWWVRPVRSNGFQGVWSEHSIVSTGGRTHMISPALNTTIDTTVPEFEWSPVPGAQSYEVYVAKDGTPGALYRDRGIVGTKIHSRGLDNGDYRAWVRSTLSDGSEVWGRPIRFTVAAAANGLTTTPLGPANPGFDTTPTFTWQATSGATSYDILLHRGTSASVITGLTGTSYTPTTNLAAANWTWSIRPVNASGVGAWSVPTSFTTSGATTFLTPTATTSDTTPTFSWQPVTGATRYSLVIFSGTSGNTQAFRDDNVTGTSVTPTTPLAAGNYRVWVRAISGTTLGEWSLQFNLTIAAVTPEATDEAQETLLASLSSLSQQTAQPASEPSVKADAAASVAMSPSSADVSDVHHPVTVEAVIHAAAIDDQFADVNEWLNAV
ncbi:MAG: choice-of-anchor Q domain-containing protein [Planctomycetaceae bacterium]